MNKELMGALDELEREKNISKETLLDAIEQSLIQAYKNHFGKADNVHVTINRETGDFSVYADRRVVEFVEDPAEEVSLVEAQKQNTNAEVGDILKVPVHSDKFGRIATQNAKNVILQKIREEERKVLFDQYHGNEKEVVTGIVQRVVGHNVSVNLGKADAILAENEQVKGETFKPTERIKVYILEVKDTPKGPLIDFHRSTKQEVSAILPIFLVSVPFVAISRITTSGFYASQRVVLSYLLIFIEPVLMLVFMLILPPLFGGQIMIWWCTVFARILCAVLACGMAVSVKKRYLMEGKQYENSTNPKCNLKNPV